MTMHCILIAVTLSMVLSQTYAISFGLPPLPGFGTGGGNDTCKDVDCQKGTCVPNSNNIIDDLLFPYHCDCDPGWTTFQTFVPFLTTSTLPCNIPNCTLDSNCTGSSPSPAPSSQTLAPAPASANACTLPGICGRGQCVVTNTSSLIPTFKCVCDPGYANVLNLTAGFCVNQCEIGGSCQNLGITIPGFSPPSPAPPASNQNATTPSPGCRYAPFAGNLLYGGALVLASVYFVLFW
ncbi:unnamed protein product [Sphagnum compactum]